MGQITLLDQNTINKIAAGEVIERPAAVVKELVENAIDAGANAITVEIKEGGISFIRITDNGSGIIKDDIRTAFLRHATSKIRKVEDLLSVISLGFRGEALASIASVSQVELVTKTGSELFGIRYEVHGGEEKTFEEIGCPEGTTFIVRNLFYNTPARRKFLKSATTEGGYIFDLIERMAVSHPNISFKLLSNNQLKLHTSGNNNLKDILYHVYGREISANLTEVKSERNKIRLQGFIGKPILSRGNRNYENYYINGRYIKSPVITKAIEEAYRPYMMSHRYPFTAIHFQIQSEDIDVNVHPTKMEVRFRNSDEIYQMTYETIQSYLKQSNRIPEVSLEQGETKAKTKNETKEVVKDKGPEPFEKKRIVEESKLYEPKSMVQEIKSVEPKRMVTETKSNTSYEPRKEIDHKLIDQTLKAFEIVKEVSEQYDVEQKAQTPSGDIEPKEVKQMDLFDEQLLSKEAVKEHKIVGQVFDTYWIVEYRDKMFLIDQHAAHEKVLYERTIHNLKTKEYSSQMILPPIVMTLSPREEEVLNKYMDIFTRIGFEIEPFGGKEYSVRAVPAEMLGIAHQDLLIEFLDSLVDEVGHTTPEVILEKVASMSCKAAVKGNHKLSVEEIKQLIDDLMELDNPYNCPHGRPVIIAMSKYEIEKKFKRII